MGWPTDSSGVWGVFFKSATVALFNCRAAARQVRLAWAVTLRGRTGHFTKAKKEDVVAVGMSARAKATMSHDTVQGKIVAELERHPDPAVNRSTRERPALVMRGMLEARSFSAAQIAAAVRRMGLSTASVESLERRCAGWKTIRSCKPRCLSIPLPIIIRPAASGRAGHLAGDRAFGTPQFTDLVVGYD